ncbi:SDR family NAD(P)-dependent oxidoreductase [Micromonospora profundi]|uniref:SDR family NAD(P)-dependent oxidoreductase n=1 Tax=Micromonospora profundi TaxID=1420889 RepID=UPI0033B2AF90
MTRGISLDDATRQDGPRGDQPALSEGGDSGRAVARRSPRTRKRAPAGSPALYVAWPAESPPSSPEPEDGRVALVSGGNRGLGLQVVRMLAERGMRVVLGSRSVESGRDAIESLGDLADRVAVRQLDITNPDSVAALTSWMDRRLGRCDVLVNNAAVLLDDDDIDATAVDLDVVVSTLNTNLLGTWRLTQAVVPLMRACGYGRIVNMSSDGDGVSPPGRGLPAYRLSKAAVNTLTRMLAAELADDGILVNACTPERAGILTGRAVPPTPLASAAVWLATLPDGGPTGGFFRGFSAVER